MLTQNLRPGLTSQGKPFDFHEQEMVRSGKWRLEVVPAEVLGLARPLEVYRATRKGKFVVPWDREGLEGYCLMRHWADVKFGQGACGLRCRPCFLVGTYRVLVNPCRHVLYENVDECVEEVRRWLKNPTRAVLGLGIDASDSLLYEGVTHLAARLIPLFASPDSNPHGCKLILLTKTANVHHLEGLPSLNTLVTFSLNPESIADLWEGKFDDGVRVTPPIAKRVAASLRAQEMGFETRWRIDPILTPDDWQEAYWPFFRDAAKAGLRPERITLGTYRETSPSLRTMAAKWGLPPMEWLPEKLVKEGMHYHVPREERVAVYRQVVDLIRAAWAGTGHAPMVALCKEPREVKQAVGLDHDRCNCG